MSGNEIVDEGGEQMAKVASVREGRWRVLIVDDAETSIIAQKMMLGSREYDFIVARTGREAIALAEQFRPDVILLDVMMPNVSGFRVCERLKQTAETCHIPVIMVTAANELVHAKTAQLYGFEDFLTKPIDREELRGKIQKYIGVGARGEAG
ncbi:MAG: response regulator [Chrysiogenetes bacterium]|nr:response regulator [Chrysiogenetes bacterium]